MEAPDLVDRHRLSLRVRGAEEFELETIEAEWRVLADEGTPAAKRAAPIVERILNNLRRGSALAQCLRH
jgi:hypothetical protein